MNEIIYSLANQLKNYGKSLSKSSIYIDKPWTMIDGDQEMQKLIFKKNGELVMSKNRKVNIGKWEYMPEANSLLIYRDEDIIMCNEFFLDDTVLILKLDGTKHEFFVLANENNLPSLDVLNYFKSLKNQESNFVRFKTDKWDIEINKHYDLGSVTLGERVYEDHNPARDGHYELLDENKVIQVKQGKISQIFYVQKFNDALKNNVKIIMQQFNSVRPGDEVYINGSLAGTINLDYFDSHILKIENGKIKELISTNKIIRFFLGQKLIKE